MRILILPFIFGLSACSLTPELNKPVAPIPPTFVQGDAPGESTKHVADIGWRQMFGDPRLQHLIELALINNRDLRIAALNVEATQAQFNIQRANRLPSIEATGAATRERVTASKVGGVAVSSNIQEQHSIGLGISSFEIDMFGRVRALSNAAFARYLASDQGRRTVQLSLVATLADTYFAERLAQSQLQLAKSTLADWRQSLDLARLLKQADQNNGLDVAQAEGQVASAEADLEARQRVLTQAHNALQLLVGEPLPTDLPEPMDLSAQSIMTELPAGLPSDLLNRRPDILQAEQNLVAANADIGAARAAFFPRLSLTASLGFASPAMNGLVGDDNRTWRFAPQITQPLFQGGRLRAELRVAKLRKSTAIAEYEKTIQTAFREVADGLAGRATFGRQIEAQTRAVASAQRRLKLSSLRYQSGVDGRLELLDSQRQLYIVRQALLNLRRDEISNAIALYKSLGGGLVNETTLPVSEDVQHFNFREQRHPTSLKRG